MMDLLLKLLRILNWFCWAGGHLELRIQKKRTARGASFLPTINTRGEYLLGEDTCSRTSHWTHHGGLKVLSPRLPPSPGSTLSSCQSSQKRLRKEFAAIRDCFSVTSTLQFQRTKILLFPYIGGHLPTLPSLTQKFLTNPMFVQSNTLLKGSVIFPRNTLNKYAFFGTSFYTVSKGISLPNLTFYSLTNS